MHDAHIFFSFSLPAADEQRRENGVTEDCVSNKVENIQILIKKKLNNEL